MKTCPLGVLAPTGVEPAADDADAVGDTAGVPSGLLGMWVP
jgi:hypothetical protein